MTRGRKRLLVVLCVLIGLIAVLSIAVRLVLTKDRLLAIVVPRIEERVQAAITVQDIGVRFPFGFGVDVKGWRAGRRDVDEAGGIRFQNSGISQSG